MKRCVFKIGLFCLAGAIINVAVAWGWSAAQSTSYQNTKLLTQVRADYEARRKTGLIDDWPSRVYSNFGCDHVVRDDHKSLEIYEHLAGWPSRALAGRYVEPMSVPIQAPPPGTIATTPAVREGILYGREVLLTTDPRAGSGWPTVIVIPCKPVWRGFAINTIFYAAIAWMLSLVPGAIRRRVRRKCGQCAACGYLLHGSPGDKCPECGATIQYRDRQGAVT
jgi:hypothetical protein